MVVGVAFLLVLSLFLPSQAVVLELTEDNFDQVSASGRLDPVELHTLKGVVFFWSCICSL